LSDTSTIFKWLVKKKRIPLNPLSEIEPKKTIATKNKYYDDATAAKLKALMRDVNPYLLKFFSTIYYTATRPKSETRLLKCKYVLWDRGLLFIPGSISKNKKDDYVPLCNEMIELLKDMGVDNADPEFYIFSSKEQPDSKPASANYFSNQFLPLKRKLGLGEEYTLYGAKHLRAIHLAQDGINPYELMRLFRHSSLDITMNYLRDLGLADNTEIFNKGRKF
jgi:integrase